jgi:hypothetical protein
MDPLRQVHSAALMDALISTAQQRHRFRDIVMGEAFKGGFS